MDDYYVYMSTAELLEQVKAMPAGRRHEFILRVLAMEAELRNDATGTSHPVQWPDVEARAKRIFGDRLLPNLVLLEREEATF